MQPIINWYVPVEETNQVEDSSHLPRPGDLKKQRQHHALTNQMLDLFCVDQSEASIYLTLIFESTELLFAIHMITHIGLILRPRKLKTNQRLVLFSVDQSEVGIYLNLVIHL